MEYTPTPWTAQERAQDPGLGKNKVFITGADGKRVCSLTREADGRTLQEARDNMEFIVRAVNAHDELVEALRMAIGVLDTDGGYDGTVDELKKALAKAEGK